MNVTKVARMISQRKNGRLGALGQRGQALAELAICLPFLLVLLIGTVDFCRIFYTSMMLTQAARTGVQYGAQSKSKATEYSNMENAAIEAATDLSHLGQAVTADATSSCECADGTAIDCDDTCIGEGNPRVFVTVTVGYTFHMRFPYPGIPNNVALTRTATLMVP